MKMALISVLCFSLLGGLSGCKSKGMKLRESVDYLIEHPDDSIELSRLVEMARTGSEVQRVVVMQELTRFARQDHSNADLVLPLIHDSLADNDGLIRRYAVLCLSDFPKEHIAASVPKLFQLMQNYPGHDTFTFSCDAFFGLKEDSCNFFPQLLEFLDHNKVHNYSKISILSGIFRNGIYCPELAVQCFQSAINHKDEQVREEAQWALDNFEEYLEDKRPVKIDWPEGAGLLLIPPIAWCAGGTRGRRALG